MASLRQALLGLGTPLLLDVASPPFEDRRGEDVVVDLVAGHAVALRRRDRPQDALALQMLERGLQWGRVRIGELAQLLGAQRDLPAARRHEEAERRGGGVALVGGQLGHDVVEVPTDDRVGTAQTLAASRAAGAATRPRPLRPTAAS